MKQFWVESCWGIVEESCGVKEVVVFDDIYEYKI